MSQDLAIPYPQTLSPPTLFLKGSGLILQRDSTMCLWGSDKQPKYLIFGILQNDIGQNPE